MDWTHVVAYDYHLPSKENFTHAHAALYDPSSHVNIDNGLRQWLAKGFPANKLVLGLPYHGYAWSLVNPKENAIGAPSSGLAVTPDGSMSYKYIKWHIRSYRDTSISNATYVVNYCILGSTWINFDGVESIRTKIAYAKEKKLLGYSAFQVINDDNWALSRAAQDEENGHGSKQKLLLIILLPIALIIILVVFMMCCVKGRVLKSKGLCDFLSLSLSLSLSLTAWLKNVRQHSLSFWVLPLSLNLEGKMHLIISQLLGDASYSDHERIILKRILILFYLPLKCHCSTPQSWVRAGYYYSGGETGFSDINSKLFTHLICAFAYVNSSTYHLSINSSTEQQFSTFNHNVKSKNPSVTTILSIWVGREQMLIFFSMINQSTYRNSFVQSSIETARLYGFQGLDLCGVLPTGSSSDMANFGTLLDEWRVAINSEAKNSSNPELLLVMAGNRLPALGSVIYPIDSMRRNLDWVHVTAYDYYLPVRDRVTYFHAALYGPSNMANTDNGINEWKRRGFLPSKLVLGLPYHGYAWTLLSPQNNPVGAVSTGPAMREDGSVGYKYFKWFIRNYAREAVCGYNATSVVNYCTFGLTWINYDDVQAIRAKVSYAKQKGLLGYNVFQVLNNDNWVLSRAAELDDENQNQKGRLLVIVLFRVVLQLFSS
ncbi:hypothetical protein I3843_16G113300 [Carya illinoinensis]|nr:hypothetical protein I3843_16G113300 [Carya illinoinensis]